MVQAMANQDQMRTRLKIRCEISPMSRSGLGLRWSKTCVPPEKLANDRDLVCTKKCVQNSSFQTLQMEAAVALADSP